MPKLRNYLLTMILLVLLLVGCTAQEVNSPAGAVESYIKALVAKDENKVVTLSCSAWEEQARQELRSFDANTISLKDLKCLQTSVQMTNAFVSCTGLILANYGSEEMSIDLSRQGYLVLREGGEWRMCGYQE